MNPALHNSSASSTPSESSNRDLLHWILQNLGDLIEMIPRILPMDQYEPIRPVDPSFKKFVAKIDQILENLKGQEIPGWTDLERGELEKLFDTLSAKIGSMVLPEHASVDMKDITRLQDMQWNAFMYLDHLFKNINLLFKRIGFSSKALSVTREGVENHVNILLQHPDGLVGNIPTLPSSSSK